MIKEPSLREYPKWVEGVVVANAREEEAVIEHRADLEAVESASGKTYRIVRIRPKDAA